MRTDAVQIAEWRGLAAQRDGIDLIVGHHAHVVRGVELAGGSLIFYGLGNFLHLGTANMTSSGICRDYGLMAKVHLRKAADGKLAIRAVEAIPVTDTHLRPRRLPGAQGNARVHALNYLAGTLDDAAGKARGLRFTPQSDGSGLFCLPGAENDTGRVGVEPVAQVDLAAESALGPVVHVVVVAVTTIGPALAGDREHVAPIRLHLLRFASRHFAGLC